MPSGIIASPAPSVMLASFFDELPAVLGLDALLTMLLFSVSATVLALSIIVITAM
ncbi:hypothetical protein [Actinomyces sp. ZJ308]|uniref:hypothetical protein n=1 Tax=Actinomyces sp. ZJ308 TaxID=2708342 RepID=UPI001FB8F908|nr:hypothetical protein [Actinomyces sp. ZJ308]